MTLFKEPEETQVYDCSGRPPYKFYIPGSGDSSLEKEAKDMLEKFGHIINSPEPIPDEVGEFLGKPPEIPEWVTEGDDDLYIPGETNKEKQIRLEKMQALKDGSLVREIDEYGFTKLVPKDKALVLREKKMIKRMEHIDNISTEKSIGHIIKSLLTNEGTVRGTYNPLSVMILEVIAHKLMNEHFKSRETVANRAVNRDGFSYTIEEIDAIEREFEFQVKLILDDREIKNVLGLERLKNKDIYQAVKDLVNIHVEGDLTCYYNPDTKKYGAIEFDGAEKFFMGVVIDKTGRKSNKTGFQEHRYGFTFRTRLSKIILINILNGNIWLKPKSSYRELRAGHHNIINYALPTGRGTMRLSLEELGTLTGVSHSRTNRKQALVEKYLDELIEQGFYLDWSKKGRGQNALYFLYRGEQ